MPVNLNIADAFHSARVICFDEKQEADENVGSANHSVKALHDREYTVFITASGKGTFPVDQLRRYQLFPTDGASAVNLIEPEYHEHDARNVELSFAHTPSETDAEQCAVRFASFGWTVTACSVSVW